MKNTSDDIRTKDFMLFNDFHGKDPQKSTDEKAMSRYLYWNKKPLEIELQGLMHHVTLIGYEIPLGTTKTNQKFIDLLGIDQYHNLYIIETKKHSSREKPSDVVSYQINEYFDKLNKSLPYITSELNQNELYARVKINSVRKMLLAPKKYFDRFEQEVSRVDSDVTICHFRMSDQYNGIASVAHDDGTIPLNTLNTKSS